MMPFSRIATPQSRFVIHLRGYGLSPVDQGPSLPKASKQLVEHHSGSLPRRELRQPPDHVPAALGSFRSSAAVQLQTSTGSFLHIYCELSDVDLHGRSCLTATSHASSYGGRPPSENVAFLPAQGYNGFKNARNRLGTTFQESPGGCRLLVIFRVPRRSGIKTPGRRHWVDRAWPDLSSLGTSSQFGQCQPAAPRGVFRTHSRSLTVSAGTTWVGVL